MTYNAASRKDIRRAEKAALAADTTRRDVLCALMSHIGGRAFVHEQLVAAHVFVSSFTGDALTSAFAEGERNVGLRLYNAIMEACPDQFVQMMREANERDRTDDARSATDRRAERSDDPDFDGADWIGDGPDPRRPG